MSSKARITALVVFMAALFNGMAQAEPERYQAVLDFSPGFESSFTFDFGGGFLESAAISNTAFVLELDAEAGSAGTAQFLSYNQQIDSINLPDPLGGSNPIPTGGITVAIIPGTSGNGSFDPIAGTFATGETYRVYFTGDLSAYGLTDGFVDLPSTSAGTITFDGSGLGRITQDWAGTYTFPGTAVSLSYSCRVNTVVVPEPVGLGWMASLGFLSFLRRR